MFGNPFFLSRKPTFPILETPVVILRHTQSICVIFFSVMYHLNYNPNSFRMKFCVKGQCHQLTPKYPDKRAQQLVQCQYALYVDE